MAKAKIVAKTKAKVKNSRKKAGSTMPRNIGGIANAKIVAIIKNKNG